MGERHRLLEHNGLVFGDAYSELVYVTGQEIGGRGCGTYLDGHVVLHKRIILSVVDEHPCGLTVQGVCITAVGLVQIRHFERDRADEAFAQLGLARLSVDAHCQEQQQDQETSHFLLANQR